LNRTQIAATLDVGVRVDSVQLDHPHPAAIHRTLPRRVPTQSGDDARLRVLIEALEVCDLELVPEEVRKEGSFRAGDGVPRSAAGSRRQAGVALAAAGVADQIRVVSCRDCNLAWNGWGRELRHDAVDGAEGTCEQERGREQTPESRKLSCSLTKVAGHFVLISLR
jgi:hypothetical protein